MVDYVYRDGSRLTPYMMYIINRLDADFYNTFGLHIVVSSGIRTSQDQIDVFLQRYVTAGNINGRTVYDTRVWNGVRYYRISSAGTVAVPGTSNHEIQGDRAAVDLRDTGSGPGVSSPNNARSNWLKANAYKYGMIPSGYGFGEAWHYDVLNIFSPVPAGVSIIGGEDLPSEEWFEGAFSSVRNLLTVPGTQYGWPQAAYNEVSSVKAGNILFPGATYSAFQAIANQNHQILAALSAFSGSSGGEPVDFQKITQESEERMKQFYAQQLQNFSVTLKADILGVVSAAVSDGDGVTVEKIAEGVEQAFSRAFAPLPVDAPS